MEEKEFNLFASFINLIWIKRKKIFLINLIVLILAVVISLLLPKIYKGRVVFIVNESAQASQISNLLGTMPFDFLGKSDDKVLQYFNFLTSYRVLDKIDSTFNLSDVYENEYRFQYYKEIKSNLVLTDNYDRTITLEFYYEDDPLLAANIANTFYKELDNLSLELNRERNKNLRIFLENSYNKAINDLQNTEKKFADFQLKSHLYNLEEQVKILIKSISELEIERLKADIKREYLKKQFGLNNKQVQDLDLQIKEISKKIKSLKTDSNFIDIPLNKIPNKGLEYYRYIREIKIYEKVLEFIVPQLENVKFEEMKTTSDLQILDKAVPEDYKTKPKRSVIIFVIVFISFILTVFIEVVREYIKTNKEFLQKIFSVNRIN